jgi:hypothetical protein
MAWPAFEPGPPVGNRRLTAWAIQHSLQKSVGTVDFQAVIRKCHSRMQVKRVIYAFMATASNL